MKYWEKFKESDLAEKAAEKHSWWVYVIFFFGFIIGVTAVALIVGLMFLTVGFFFSLLWNFAVAPISGLGEITTCTAAGILVFTSLAARFLKWAFR